MTTYINVFGAPGAGKSTFAAGLFFTMKQAGFNCELITEVAKGFTWEKRTETLKVQPYVDTKQYRNLKVLQGSVDYVITDSPILKGIVYAREYTDLPDSYYQLLRWFHNDLNPNYNVLVRRGHKYEQTGRNQTSEEADRFALIFESFMAYGLKTDGSAADIKKLLNQLEVNK